MQSVKITPRVPLLPKSSSWYQIYFAAVVESDPYKALFQMESAQKAMQDRIIELHRTPFSSTGEMEDLKSAMNYLGLLLENMQTQHQSQQWD